MEEFYRCPAKGQGGCSTVTRIAEPINTYIKALVIAEQQKIEFRKVEELPPWPKSREMADLQQRINDQQKNYELGNITVGRHFPSLARMEASEAELKSEKRRYEGQQSARRHAVANLAQEWDKPDFTMEQKQAAIGETLSAVIVNPAGKGVRFHPDQIIPVFRQEDEITA
jgi:site-specific DNA recombinase